MATFLAASDLVVSRAGAIFLSEAAVLGVPLIMIPFPHAAENHQTYNARVWEENGAGLLIPEAEISSLEDKLLALLDDPSRRKKWQSVPRRWEIPPPPRRSSGDYVARLITR